MRLYEIQEGAAAEQRVKRLKDNARSAKDRASQIKGQADASAAALEIRTSRKKQEQRRISAPGTTIKPHA